MKIAALLAVLLTVGAVTAFFSLRNSGMEIVHPKRGDITEAVYGLGKVKSNNRFEVIVGVVSTVTRLHVREGDRVAKGAPLIEFDSHAVFRAPFSGTVTFVKAYAGETAVPNVPILRLEDLSDRYIELSLEQQGAIRIKTGLPAKVSFESVRGKVLEGKVSALFPREDEFLAQVKLEGLDESVLPGMTADVTIEVGQIKDVLLAPLRAVQNGMITVRRGGSWKKERVEVGHVDGVYAELKGNSLTPSDELRVKAQEK